VLLVEITHRCLFLICLSVLLAAAALPTVTIVDNPAAVHEPPALVNPPTRTAALVPLASGQTDTNQSLDPSTRRFREENLPDTTDLLLAELRHRSKEVESLLEQGDFGSIWLPALRVKDVALALEENHLKEVSDRRRPMVTSAVTRLTVVAWQIDSAGDLGNKEKLNELYKLFSAAVADIESIYASTR
jgi:hypothetical protein